MKWSWKLGRVSGIKIQVHWTFLILIAWVILVHASQGANLLEVAGGVFLVLAVFGCVVLHELGHALTAKQFGIKTRDITLLPIGGVARLERMPEEPWREFLVAAAGPAVNVVIAGLLYAGLALTSALQGAGDVAVVGGNPFVQLMWLNVVLVLFNLLPAFPMDGGRILRALLAVKLDYVRATRIAAALGQAAAIFFGFVGLFGFFGLFGPNPFLVFIAIFVYLGAQAEAQQVQQRFALEGITAADAMMTRFHTLAPDDTLQDAVDELLAGAQQDFPVLDGHSVVGVLSRAELVKALKQHGGSLPVSAVMRRDCPVIAPDEGLHQALTRLRAARCSSLPVLSGGALVGLLTLENVGELLMVSSALDGAGGRGKLADIFATE